MLLLEFEEVHEFEAQHERLERLERRELGLAQDLDEVGKGRLVGLELAGQLVDLVGEEVVGVEVTIREDGCQLAIVLGLEQLQHQSKLYQAAAIQPSQQRRPRTACLSIIIIKRPPCWARAAFLAGYQFGLLIIRKFNVRMELTFMPRKAESLNFLEKFKGKLNRVDRHSGILGVLYGKSQRYQSIADRSINTSITNSRTIEDKPSTPAVPKQRTRLPTAHCLPAA